MTYLTKQQMIEGAPALQLSDTDASITFNDVMFGYSREKEILKDVSFHVGSGQSVGIVGGSGSGKSTMIRLLYRLNVESLLRTSCCVNTY